MNIYALKGPSSVDYDPEELQRIQKFLTDSIKNGVSRFGWGYDDSADLIQLSNKTWQQMTRKEEQDCWQKANFLLGIEKGDWVVHINLPYWGACLAGQVIETYSFEQHGNPFEDYRHLLKLDKNSIVEFDRNDDRVHPVIGSRLKLQGRYWTIQFQGEFLQTLENLKKEKIAKKENEGIGVFYLRNELSPLLKEVTKKVQKNHPGGKLEAFVAAILRKLPNVIDVKEHGLTKGFGTDDGADLVVTYSSGLPITTTLEKHEILVVQVKSYVNQHWETTAVEQIETGIKQFKASAGLIISTAESTVTLEKAIEDLTTKLSNPEDKGGLNKQIPIGLIAGENVAKFVLKYGADFIL